jgi:hypothetical protein
MLSNSPMRVRVDRGVALRLGSPGKSSFSANVWLIRSGPSPVIFADPELDERPDISVSHVGKNRASAVSAIVS